MTVVLADEVLQTYPRLGQSHGRVFGSKVGFFSGRSCITVSGGLNCIIASFSSSLLLPIHALCYPSFF